MGPIKGQFSHAISESNFAKKRSLMSNFKSFVIKVHSNARVGYYKMICYTCETGKVLCLLYEEWCWGTVNLQLRI